MNKNDENQNGKEAGKQKPSKTNRVVDDNDKDDINDPEDFESVSLDPTDNSVIHQFMNQLLTKVELKVKELGQDNTKSVINEEAEATSSISVEELLMDSDEEKDRRIKGKPDDDDMPTHLIHESQEKIANIVKENIIENRNRNKKKELSNYECYDIYFIIPKFIALGGS